MRSVPGLGRPYAVGFTPTAAAVDSGVFVWQPGAISGPARPRMSVGRRVAPAFAAREKTLIARWSARMRRRGVRAEIVTEYEFLAEALRVTLHAADECCWLVHKTPPGQVAVRVWPGTADIVTTVAEALAIVGAAADRAGSGTRVS